MTLLDYIKNFFFLLLFFNIAPFLIIGAKNRFNQLNEPRTKIALIAITGTLHNSECYTKQLDYFFKRPDIKAIVISMDCFGSAAGTGQIIFNEIQSLKKEYLKPIITRVENICTSGGYLIASATDYIIAPPSALIGSIGSYFLIIQLHDFLQKHTINFATIKTETYKSIGNQFSNIEEQNKYLLQSLQNDTYQEFTQTISKKRKLSLAQVNDWADDKIFTGRQALKLQLIDEIGSTQNVIKILKEKTLIEGEIEWVTINEKPSQLSFLNGNTLLNTPSLITMTLNSICNFLET